MADMRRLVISGGTVITPHQVLADHSLVLEAGKVAGILPSLASHRNDAQRIDATGLWVVPGLIANNFERQGVLVTTASIVTVTVAVYFLAQMLRLAGLLFA